MRRREEREKKRGIGAAGIKTAGGTERVRKVIIKIQCSKMIGKGTIEHMTQFLTEPSLGGHPLFCIPTGRQRDRHFLPWTSNSNT